MWITTTSDEPGGAPGVPAVFVIDLVSGRQIARLDDVVLAAWSPDGTRLALLRATDRRQVDIADGDGANRHSAGQPVGGLIDQLVWVH